MTISDEEIMWALIDQVANATASARMQCASANERSVVTFVTRPMWNAFLRAGHIVEDSAPTPWIGDGTIRVYGSETFVVENEGWWSFSMPRPQ